MKKYIIFTFICSCAASLAAQTGKNPPVSLEATSQDVFTPFKAKLLEARKLESRPTLPEPKRDEVSLDQYVVPKPVTKIAYDAPSIKPLAMPKEKIPADYCFYSKVGFGSPLQPLAEISYNNKKNEQYAFGASYRYHSNNSNKPLQYQRFTDHAAAVNGTYYLPKTLAIGANLGYDWNGRRFYGADYASDTTLTEDSLRQHFSKFSAGARVFNREVNEYQFNYGADVNFYTLRDRYKSKELGLGVKLYFSKYFGDNHIVKVVAGMDYAKFTDTSGQSLTAPYIKPSYTYHGSNFRAKIGGYIGTDNKKFFAAPDVELSYNLWKEKLAIFVGWTGEVRLNSYDRMRQYNPYLNSVIELRNTRYQEGYGGVRGEAGKVTYEARAAYRMTNVMPLFYNDARRPAYGRFNVLYDTTTVFTVSGNISFPIIEGLSFSGNAAYHFYNFKSAAYGVGLGLPNYEANLTLKYNWKNKFLTRLEYIGLGGINYVKEDYTTSYLNPMFDISLCSEFRVNDHFGIFLDVNNILNQKAQRWYRYPQYGINVIGGVTVKF